MHLRYAVADVHKSLAPVGSVVALVGCQPGRGGGGQVAVVVSESRAGERALLHPEAAGAGVADVEAVAADLVPADTVHVEVHPEIRVVESIAPASGELHTFQGEGPVESNGGA